MPKKKATSEELTRRMRRLVAEGKVEFAPPPPPELVPPLEFQERFAREILRCELDDYWASGESDMEDLTPRSRKEILADLSRVYGVDCSDMKSLNLWRVMQRCMPAGQC